MQNCCRQFIGDHQLSYSGCNLKLTKRIELMLVRNIGIRDISEIEGVNIGKVLSVLSKSSKVIKPKQKHYTRHL